MRIVHCLRALVAVLSLAAILFPVSANNSDNSTIFSPRRRHNILDPLSKPWLHSKQELQQLLWKKSVESGDAGSPIDCCPSVLEMVEPNGGTNRHGMYVQLYQDGALKQRFYELSCERNVEGHPCRFMDRKLHNMSRCVQKFSYSYALVREQQGSGSGSGAGGGGAGEPAGPRHHHHLGHAFPLPSAAGPSPADSGWMLDYIRVRSGCSCEVTPKTKKKRTNPHKIKKSKKKFRLDDDDSIS